MNLRFAPPLLYLLLNGGIRNGANEFITVKNFKGKKKQHSRMKKLTQFCISDLQSVSILSIAEWLGLQVNKHKKCICPFHADKMPSLKLWPSINAWKCYGCDQKGTNIDLVMKKEGLKFDEACQWIASRSGIQLRYDDNSNTPDTTYHVQSPTYHSQPSTFNLQPTTNNMFTLPHSLVSQCQGVSSSFCRSLLSNGILTEQQLQQAASLYHLGCTKDYGVIFWQIDQDNQVREGKVMFYLSDCHRDHQRNPTWVSYRLKKQGRLTSDWQATYCLFGLHLLNTDAPNSIIAVVESEKTAVICSQLLPTFNDRHVIWMASGGLDSLTVESLRPLVGKDVTIFPDTDPTGKTFSKWQEVVTTASKELNHTFYISNILELHATPEQKQRKIDIADLFIPNSQNQ